MVLQGNSPGGRVGEDEGYKVGTEFTEAGLFHGPYHIGNESNGGHAAAEAYAGAISSLLVDCVECTLGLVVSLLLSFGVNHSDKLVCRMASSIHQPEEQNEHTDWYDECRLFLHTHVKPELRLDKESPGRRPTLGPAPPGKDSDCARHKASSSDVVPHSLRKSLFQVSTKVAPNGVTAPIPVTTTRRRGGVVIFYLVLPQRERR